MTVEKTFLSKEGYTYLLQHSLRESSILSALREATLQLPEYTMMSAPEEAQLLALLANLIQARRVIEVGVFTGYTTLALAQALPTDGQVIACDISTKFTAIGQPFWKSAGVLSKIDLRIAPALDTLDQLLTEGMAGQFDLIFIDADKENYPHYFERALRLVRTQGLIAIDNTLGITRAKVFDAEVAPQHQAIIQAIRKFNAALFQDHRVFMSMLPVAQGLTLALKKGSPA